MTVEVHRGEAVWIVDHLAVETLEQGAVGREAAVDRKGFEPLPLIRGQPVADFHRDRQERRLGSLPEPVEDSETGLGLPPVPPPLGLAVGVVGHLGDADAHAVVRVVGCEFSRSSLERFQSGRCRRVELEARQVAVDVAVMRA